MLVVATAVLGFSAMLAVATTSVSLRYAHCGYYCAWLSSGSAAAASVAALCSTTPLWPCGYFCACNARHCGMRRLYTLSFASIASIRMPAMDSFVIEELPPSTFSWSDGQA